MTNGGANCWATYSRCLNEVLSVCGRLLSGVEIGGSNVADGSRTAGRASRQRSFERPGGPEDVQTLPTAVHSPCFSPLNASDDCSAPTADIVPSLQFELGQSSCKWTPIAAVADRHDCYAFRAAIRPQDRRTRAASQKTASWPAKKRGSTPALTSIRSSPRHCRYRLTQLGNLSLDSIERSRRLRPVVEQIAARGTLTCVMGCNERTRVQTFGISDATFPGDAPCAHDVGLTGGDVEEWQALDQIQRLAGN